MTAVVHPPGAGERLGTPGGWEHDMRDLAEAARSEAMTLEAIGRVAARYDVQLAD